MSLNTATLPTIQLNHFRPPIGRMVMLTGKDRIGEYQVGFPCQYDGEGFINPATGSRLTVNIVAWRPVHVLDKAKPRKPGRLTFKDVRAA